MLLELTFDPYRKMTALRRRYRLAFIAHQQAIFAPYRRGWKVAAKGGMLCDCATGDEAAGWQASRDADAAMRKCEVR